MGFLDSIFGRTKLPKSNEDRLFAMSSAVIGLQASASLTPSGRSAIVFRKLPPGRFDQLESDMTQLLSLQGEDSGLKVARRSDELGFDWLIVEGSDFQGAIAALHSAAQSLLEAGLGDLLLACAFRFDQDGRPVYWIYGYKQASFYPFVPQGDHRRDNAEELRLASIAKSELPVEADLERWYALWGIPV